MDINMMHITKYGIFLGSWFRQLNLIDRMNSRNITALTNAASIEAHRSTTAACWSVALQTDNRFNNYVFFPCLSDLVSGY